MILSNFPGGGTDTSDATAAAPQILSSYTAYANDVKITGTMPNNGAVTITPSASDQAIAAGYHNGSGKVNAVTFVASKLLTGTTVAGTAGTMPNKVGTATTITPSTADQAIPQGYYGGVVGDGKVAAVTGTATAGDVTTGKTFSSAAGVNLAGTGANAKNYASGSYTTDLSGIISITGLGFTPAMILVQRGDGGGTYYPSITPILTSKSTAVGNATNHTWSVAYGTFSVECQATETLTWKAYSN